MPFMYEYVYRYGYDSYKAYTIYKLVKYLELIYADKVKKLPILNKFVWGCLKSKCLFDLSMQM